LWHTFSGVESIKPMPVGFPRRKSRVYSVRGEDAATHELHKPIVTDQMGEIAGKLFATVLLIIPFETPVSAEVKQYRNNHHLAEGQALRGNHALPVSVGSRWIVQ
jgi:hypothetical protein